MESYSTYIEVNLDKIKENLSELCKKTNKSVKQIIAVVKDNAYGLGAGYIAKTLQDAGVAFFATANIDEAVFLRKKGITGNILVLGAPNEKTYALASQHNITLSIINMKQLDEIYYDRDNFKLHINIDTGMKRDGISYEDVLEDNSIVKKLSDFKNSITGVYTHFHSSDDKEPTDTNSQKRYFRRAVSTLKAAGLNFDVIHTYNSAACAYFDTEKTEFIRPGILIYGCKPNPKRNILIDVSCAASIFSKIVSIRKIKKGECVSYGHTWKAKKDGKIATVQIGYGSGFPRVLNSTAFVSINNKKFPIVGRVTMDYIMVEIGENDKIEIGDEVIVAANEREENVNDIDALAIAADTIGYELLCKFGAALPHKYVCAGKVVGYRAPELF